MIRTENFVSDVVRRAVEALYGPLDGEQLQIQKTRREFEGDYTLVTFPLLRRSRKSPEATAFFFTFPWSSSTRSYMLKVR